jgi:hypothetical protein
VDTKLPTASGCNNFNHIFGAYHRFALLTSVLSHLSPRSPQHRIASCWVPFRNNVNHIWGVASIQPGPPVITLYFSLNQRFRFTRRTYLKITLYRADLSQRLQFNGRIYRSISLRISSYPNTVSHRAAYPFETTPTTSGA